MTNFRSKFSAIFCSCIVSLILISVGCSETVDSGRHATQRQQSGGSVLFDVSGALFTGTYRDVPVEISSNVSCSFDELDFGTTGTATGNRVSKSKGPDFDPSNPTVRVLAGGATGTYELLAFCEGEQVGEEAFEIKAEYQNATATRGPSRWITKKTSNEPAVHASDLQNKLQDTGKVHEAPSGEVDVLVLFFDYTDTSWSDKTSFDEARQYFKENLSSGFDANVPHDGQFSVDKFIEDSSGDATEMNFTFVPFSTEVPVKYYVSNLSKNENGGKDGPWGSTRHDKHPQLYLNQFQEKVQNLASKSGNDISEGDYLISNYDQIVFVRTAHEQSTEVPRADTIVDEENDPSKMCDGLDNDGDGLVDEKDPDMQDEGDDPCGNEGDSPCGDGWVAENSNEECDDGDSIPYNGCNNNCQVSDDGWFAKPIVAYRERKMRDRNGKVAADKPFLFWAYPVHQERGEHPFQSGIHEFNHAMGNGFDLYTNHIQWNNTRGLNHRTPQAKAERWPFLTVKSLYELGWIPKSEVYTFDSRTVTTNSGGSKTIKLRPTNSGSAPDSDRYLGIQVWMSRNHHYYIGYRLGQNSSEADQNAPFEQEQDDGDGSVLVAEFWENTALRNDELKSEQKVRPLSLPLDNSNAVVDMLEEGESFEVDLANTNNPPKMTIEATDLAQTSSGRHQAKVKITTDKPTANPSITPWKKEKSGWKSPDIMLRNSRTKNASTWDEFNKPAPGENNIVVARVTNEGDAKAKDVEVSFSVKDFAASGGGNFIFKDKRSRVKDIPAGKTKEFQAVWNHSNVPTSGHYCIKAEIQPIINDADYSDNTARSNFSGDWSSAASPAERERATITIENPYSQEVTYYLHLNQTHADYRAYLEHRWVTVSPGATVSVDFEYEYAGDFASRYAEDNSYRPKNLVSVHTTHTVPGAADGERELQRKRRGAQVTVRTGYTTDLDVVDFDAESEYLEATVSRVHDGSDVTNGKVLFNVVRSDGTQDSYLDPLNSNGRAKVSANLTDWESVYVQYLGSYPDAPSDIKEFHR